MARFLKSKKESIGLAPDMIMFRGEKKVDFTRLRLIDYDENMLNEKEVEHVEDIVNLKNTSTTSWFNIDGLHDEEVMQKVSEGFGLDSLIIPDVLNTHGRPRLVEYGNCLYISTKMLKFNEDKGQIYGENLVLLIKKHMLITFQEKVGDVFEPVRERLRKNRRRIRSSGPDFLAFALLDIVIDNYIYIISRIGEQIEDLDDELIDTSSSETLSKINRYKSEINYLAKSINPTRELIFSLVKLDSEFLTEKVRVHLKELQDNINLANDSIESYRTILSDQLSIFHTNSSNKLNDILKVLTIFSVIFIPLSFIAGIYGTNFKRIPLATFENGYFLMWIIIVIVALAMVLYFKRKKWF